MSKKIERNYKKIREKLIEINPEIFIDILTSLYNDNALKTDFQKYINKSYSLETDAITVIPAVAREIINNLKHAEKMLADIIKRNNNYISRTSFIDMSQEQLTSEFNKNIVPSLHGVGISPDMLILYNFSKHIFKGADIDFLKKEYLLALEKIKTNVIENSAPETIQLEGRLKNSITESDFVDYFNDNFKSCDDAVFEEIGNKYHCSYQKEIRAYNNVRRGVILFLHNKLQDAIDEILYAKHLYVSMGRLIGKLNLFAGKQHHIVSENQKLRETTAAAERKIKALQRENFELQKLSGKKVENKSELERQLAEKEKENYYIKSRVEQLEEKIAILEEEKAINTEIAENIEIGTPAQTKKPEVPEYQNIIILGGYWNSREKEAVTEFFAEHNSTVDFVEAEKTLRNIDRIENADLVIFDTSRNAHKYYARVKKLNLLHITKSSAEKLTSLF